MCLEFIVLNHVFCEFLYSLSFFFASSLCSNFFTSCSLPSCLSPLTYIVLIAQFLFMCVCVFKFVKEVVERERKKNRWGGREAMFFCVCVKERKRQCVDMTKGVCVCVPLTFLCLAPACFSRPPFGTYFCKMTNKHTHTHTRILTHTHTFIEPPPSFISIRSIGDHSRKKIGGKRLREIRDSSKQGENVVSK